MATFSVILPAAGANRRFHDKHYKKVYAPLDGRAVWLHSAEKFVNRDDVKQVILVISEGDRDYFGDAFAANAALLGVQIVIGGPTRGDSVANALAKVSREVDFIVIHDAARPCICEEWISTIFAKAEESDAVIFAIPISGTIKRVGPDQKIEETVSREGLWEAQTPQVFRRQLLLDAYAQRGDEPFTDDAQLLERQGHPVAVLPGSPINIKITTKQDLHLAEKTIKALPRPNLFGSAHPFADDDKWR